MSRLKYNNNYYKIIARKSYIIVYRKYFRGIDLFCSRVAIYSYIIFQKG